MSLVVQVIIRKGLAIVPPHHVGRRTKPESTEITLDGKFVELGNAISGPIWAASSNHVLYTLNGEDRLLVVSLPKDRKQTTKLSDLVKPTCLTLWPDEGQLVIGDAGGKFLWTARVEKDGMLGTPDRYYSLRVKPGEKGSGVTAMVMDTRNLLYAATTLGVQVFDPTGRLCGVMLPPANENMTAITIGGKDANQLFIACGDKIYSRKIQGKAAYTLKKDK
jgi:gluconolactonase